MDRTKRNINQFNGERYSFWKMRVRSLLNECDLINVIDEEKPEISDKNWLKKDNSAKNIVIEYLNDVFLGFAKPNYTTKEIFNDLDNIYERKSLASELSLRKKLLLFKYESDKPLLTHFKVFDDLITELLAAGAKLNEMDKISHLLLTLPSSYDSVVTAIETLSAEHIFMAFVRTRLLDTEIKLKSESTDTSAKILTAINSKPNANNNRHKQNFKRFQQTKFKKSKIQRCHHCGRSGHYKKDCFYYKSTFKNNKKEIKYAQIANAEGFAFMIGHQNLYSDKTSFLIDSSASDHIVKDVKLFTSYKNIQPPIKIMVAKSGEFIETTKEGCAQLITNENVPIILENVLYCENVAHN